MPRPLGNHVPVLSHGLNVKLDDLFDQFAREDCSL
jgi:hypothetical protein